MLPLDFKGLEDWVEVFAAGEQTDSKGNKRLFTTADLDAMVSNHSAPIPHVITHDELYSPFAYGLGHKIKRDGDKLLVKSKKIEPQFAQLIEDGRLSERSVRIVQGDSGWKVEHIAWLGSQPPAVSGLAPVQFSASTTSMDFSLVTKQEDMPMALTPEQEAEQKALRDKAVADAKAEFSKDAAEAKAKADADKQAALDAVKADHAKALAAKDAEIKQVADHAAAKAFEDVIDTAISQGRLTPAQAIGAAEFHASLPAETFDFSKDDGKSKETVAPRQWLSDFMSGLPKQIAMTGDITDADGNEIDTGNPEVLAKAMSEYQARRAAEGVTVTSAEALAYVKRSGEQS